MSVVEAILAFSGLSGKDELSGRRDYVQKWKVRTDRATDGPVLVKAYPTVPQFGTFYKTPTESDSAAYLRERDCEPESADSSLLWVVTCNFSTHADSGQGNQGNSLIPPPQPFDVPIVMEWDSHEEKEPAYFCLGDNEEHLPIVNSAGDLYDPPPERIRTIQVLRLKKNLADFDYVLWAKYANVVNSDTWLGFQPATVLFKPPKASFVSQRGFGYWDTTFEFHIDYRGWFHFFWDLGFREYQTEFDELQGGPDVNSKTGGAKKKSGYYWILDAKGNAVPHPVLLNGAGHPLIKPGENFPKDIASKATLYKFRTQRKLPFGPLGII